MRQPTSLVHPSVWTLPRWEGGDGGGVSTSALGIVYASVGVVDVETLHERETRHICLSGSQGVSEVLADDRQQLPADPSYTCPHFVCTRPVTR